MSNLFGNGGILGSNGSETSSSSNLSYPYLQGALSPNIGNVAGAGGQLANLLGLNGGPAQNQGFTNWRNSTGYQFGLDQGLNSITGNAATQGLLNSGGTLKAMDTYGQNYANTQYGNYFNQLQGLLNSGNQSAGVLANAGQVSSGSRSGPGQAALGQLLNKGADVAGFAL